MRAQPVLERRRGDRLAVQEVAPAGVDAEDDFVVTFGTLVEVLALRHRRLEAAGDEGRHDHEDDQQHQHHVDHRNDVRLRLDLGLARLPN